MPKNLEQPLDQDFQVDGKWWLPGDPGLAIVGRLTYKPNQRMFLELFDAFAELLELKDFRTDIILGVTVEGHLCTLFGNMRSQFKGAWPGLVTQSFTCDYLYVGHHFATLEDIQFSEYQIGYWGLEEWLGEQTISVQVTMQEERRGFTASFQEKSPQRFALPNKGGEMYFAANASNSFGRRHGRQFVTIDTEMIVGFKSDSSQSYRWYEATFFDIERLFALMTGYATSPARILARVTEEKNSLGSLFRDRHSEDGRDVSRVQMMLTYPVLSEQFQDYVSRWLAVVDEFRPVIDIFFGTLYQPQMYLQLRFLALMQALEGYHRIRTQGQRAPNSLRGKLNALYQSIPCSLRHHVHEETDTFFTNLVNTRDYYTHYIPQRKQQRLNTSGMLDACNRLRTFMTIFLLLEIGLETSTVLKAAERLETYVLPKVTVENSSE